MIHYHGGNFTDRQFWGMSGKHFCVSFLYPKWASQSVRTGQSVMFDNGAFSIYTQNKNITWDKYYSWVEKYIGHPHWAVVPDCIDGKEADNLDLIKQWPFRKDCAAIVWHLSESIDHLLKLSNLGFGKIAFGSSGDYWQVGSDRWERRTDMAFNALAKRGQLPWVHLMRGLSIGGKRWPFSSADSTSISMHQNEDSTNSSAESFPVAEYLARQVDSSQTPIEWKIRAEQLDMI